MKTFAQAHAEKSLSPAEEKNLFECYQRITNSGNSVFDDWAKQALIAIIHCAPVVVRRKMSIGAGIVLQGWFPKDDGISFVCIGMVEGTDKCAYTECDQSLWAHLVESVIDDVDLTDTVWELSTEAGTRERLKVNAQIGELASVSFWDFKHHKWGLAARHMFKSNLLKHYTEIKNGLKAKGEKK